MTSVSDLSLWENIKKTLRPLKKCQDVEPSPMPKKLKVNAPPERTLLYTLDLHGLTIEQAYQTLRLFIGLHIREKSRSITIITGKGSPQKEGLIHREIKNWLDTPFFQEKITEIRWLNGGGALELTLKRKK